MAVSKNVAKYNNNGPYKELTLIVGTIYWHREPMRIQSVPACQQFDCSSCLSYSSSAPLSKFWRDEALGTAYSLLLECGLDRAGCHIPGPSQRVQLPWLHSLYERVSVGSHRYQGGTSHMSTQRRTSHYHQIRQICLS